MIRNPLIEMRSIGLTVKSPDPTRILSEVDLTVDAGDSVAIVGPSGAGKTTLASILGALQAPTSGTYQFGGRDLVGHNSAQLSTFRREHVGFVFQQSHLIDERTAQMNVALGVTDDEVSRRVRDERSLQALEQVGLAHLADRRAAHLSGGERHRVAIARAMVKMPTVLIADEPTAALDRARGLEVLELLSTVTRRGTTLIVVSHDERASVMANQVVHVLDGRIV